MQGNFKEIKGYTFFAFLQSYHCPWNMTSLKHLLHQKLAIWPKEIPHYSCVIFYIFAIFGKLKKNTFLYEFALGLTYLFAFVSVYSMDTSGTYK